MLIVSFALIVFSVFYTGNDNVKQSGTLAEITLAFSFATAAHNSVFTFLVGLPFERAMIWHTYFSVWTFVLSVWHAAIAGYSMDTESVTGLVATLGSGLMMVSMYEPIRRKSFELFYRFHWVVTFMILAAVVR